MEEIDGPAAGRDFAGPAAASSGGAIIGYRDLAGTGFDLLVAGTTAITAVIEFGGRDLIVEDAAGRTASSGFVVGLPMAPMRVRGTGTECVEIRLSPLRAHALGIAAAELGRGAVAVEDLWGSDVGRLREQLAAARSWEERFARTNSFLAHCDRSMRPPDPEVVAGWEQLLATGGRVRVAELADTLGWSRKRLWSRFEAQLGLNPKRAAMLVRFRCAVDGLLAGRPPAEVAAMCGSPTRRIWPGTCRSSGTARPAR
ncbi:helix-turn-helix domain-containing protein [Nocardia stercoris]|uniref:AraC family transcriptional regulator n=1 Tax=Nocardia stercoris TaxID=2483361 RepID=UPI001F452A6A|nr:AraC family transcriptional regulator [Nocardia stercoris]